MFTAIGPEPVATDFVGKGIKAAKKRIRDFNFPEAAGFLRPSGDDFRTPYFDRFAAGGLIGDAVVVGCSPPRRIDFFPVNAFMHRNHIARLGDVRGLLYCQKRFCLRPLIRIVACFCHMVFRGLCDRCGKENHNEQKKRFYFAFPVNSHMHD